MVKKSVISFIKFPGPKKLAAATGLAAAAALLGACSSGTDGVYHKTVWDVEHQYYGQGTTAAESAADSFQQDNRQDVLENKNNTSKEQNGDNKTSITLDPVTSNPVTGKQTITFSPELPVKNSLPGLDNSKLREAANELASRLNYENVKNLFGAQSLEASVYPVNGQNANNIGKADNLVIIFNMPKCTVPQNVNDRSDRFARMIDRAINGDEKLQTSQMLMPEYSDPTDNPITNNSTAVAVSTSYKAPRPEFGSMAGEEYGFSRVAEASYWMESHKLKAPYVSLEQPVSSDHRLKLYFGSVATGENGKKNFDPLAAVDFVGKCARLSLAK